MSRPAEAKTIRRKEAILKLDKERKFALNLNALANLEEIVEPVFVKDEQGNEYPVKDVTAYIRRILTKDFRAIRGVLWAGMTSFERISVEEVGELITVENLHDVMDALIEHCFESMPQPNDVDSKKK